MPKNLSRLVEPPRHYRPGTYFDVSCEAAEKPSYESIEKELRAIESDYPNDVELFSAGESEGYGGPENALPIWGIHLKATDESKRTIYLGAGHHPEISGPLSSCLIARRLLEPHYDQKESVHQLRKENHIMVIPIVNVDLYNNLDQYDHSRREEYWKKAYGMITTDRFGMVETIIKKFEANFYGHPDQHDEEFGFPPLKQSMAVKSAIEDAIKLFGKPLLAFDYHETRWGDWTLIKQMSPEGFPIKGYTEPEVDPMLFYRELLERDFDPYDHVDPSEISTLSIPEYALREIAKISPGPINLDMRTVETLRMYGCTEFMASKGAEAFTFETQRDLTLEDKIRINLLGTDRILAKHFLGI